MIQVQNMQQPAQGVTAELYSQVEDYLALGKPGVENETSTQKKFYPKSHQEKQQ